MFNLGSRRSRLLCAALTCFVCAVGTHSTAQADSSAESQRARLSAPDEPQLRFTPVKLDGGSRLTLISPSKWSRISDALRGTLSATHREYSALLGEIPAFSTSIRLMDEQSFFELTGAPTWTNAMYFRGQIIIPIATDLPIDMENLRRAVRHEFTHAVLSALSGGRAPGWLDEGIAQWAEGSENPALQPALRSWLERNEPVPLRFLQGGFTKLNPAMVPAAYAQSLFAARSVMKTYGLGRVSLFLRALREGFDKRSAFVAAFGVSDAQFEARLGVSLRRWVEYPTTLAHHIHNHDDHG
jgi:hypothetical protein